MITTPESITPRHPSLREVDDALATKTLYHFVRQTWRNVETKKFVSNWHIEMICEYMEAVAKRQVKRLIINMPPRHMKSLGVSVFYCPWLWLRDPGHQFLYASYAQPLAIRDSVKSRRVIQGYRYKELLESTHPDLVLTGDQNTKIRFENNYMGYRLATSVDGSLTGEGGDTIIVDDPHNVREGESLAARLACLNWWDEAMSTRLNDPKTGAYVIVQQRVHENDLTGHIMEKEAKDWEHCVLPARFEHPSRIRSTIGFFDPRTKEGQPLWPSRFGDDELKSLEQSLGTYASAGQLQQRPAPREGGMFKPADFQIVQAYNCTLVEKAVRYWDKAGTEGGGARTAGVLILKMKYNWNDKEATKFLIADVVKGQWSALTREKQIKQVADMDGELPFPVTTWVEQEPGSGGKESAENTVRQLAGHNIFSERVTGDKGTRAEPLAAQAEGGNVFMLQGHWNAAYVAELGMFPAGKFKDQVDASSGAFNKLFVKKALKPKVGTF